MVNQDFVSKLRARPLDEGASPTPKLNMPVYQSLKENLANGISVGSSVLLDRVADA